MSQGWLIQIQIHRMAYLGTARGLPDQYFSIIPMTVFSDSLFNTLLMLVSKAMEYFEFF